MFEDKRVLAIVNPSSGTGAAEELAAAISPFVMDHGGRDCVTRLTRGPSDATTWARDAAERGFDLVLAAGGDGTVTAVATGIFHASNRLPIGILPLGTGNGLARVLELPLEPLETLQALAGGKLVDLDVIELTSHDLVSLLFFGAGLDANINRDADGEQKARFGWLAYLKATFSNIRGVKNHDLTLTLDGRVEKLRGHTVSAFNATHMRFLGVQVGPDAQPHDGVMSVAVLRSTNVFVTVAQLLRLVNRSASRTELTAATDLRLAAFPDLPVQVDGDVVGETPVEARLRPAAVAFIADAGYQSRRADAGT